MVQRIQRSVSRPIWKIRLQSICYSLIELPSKIWVHYLFVVPDSRCLFFGNVNMIFVWNPVFNVTVWVVFERTALAWARSGAYVERQIWLTPNFGVRELWSLRSDVIDNHNLSQTVLQHFPTDRKMIQKSGKAQDNPVFDSKAVRQPDESRSYKSSSTPASWSQHR